MTPARRLIFLHIGASKPERFRAVLANLAAERKSGKIPDDDTYRRQILDASDESLDDFADRAEAAYASVVNSEYAPGRYEEFKRLQIDSLKFFNSCAGDTFRDASEALGRLTESDERRRREKGDRMVFYLRGRLGIILEQKRIEEQVIERGQKTAFKYALIGIGLSVLLSLISVGLVELYKNAVAAENRTDDRRFALRHEIRLDIQPKLTNIMKTLLSISTNSAPLDSNVTVLKASFLDLDESIAPQIKDIEYAFDMATVQEETGVTAGLGNYYVRLVRVKQLNNQDSLVAVKKSAAEYADKVAELIASLARFE